MGRIGLNQKDIAYLPTCSLVGQQRARRNAVQVESIAPNVGATLSKVELVGNEDVLRRNRWRPDAAVNKMKTKWNKM